MWGLGEVFPTDGVWDGSSQPMKCRKGWEGNRTAAVWGGSSLEVGSGGRLPNPWDLESPLLNQWGPGSPFPNQWDLGWLLPTNGIWRAPSPTNGTWDDSSQPMGSGEPPPQPMGPGMVLPNQWDLGWFSPTNGIWRAPSPTNGVRERFRCPQSPESHPRWSPRTDTAHDEEFAEEEEEIGDFIQHDDPAGRRGVSAHPHPTRAGCPQEWGTPPGVGILGSSPTE